MSITNSNPFSFLNKAKVQAQEIFDQFIEYMTSVYKQSGKVFSISSAYGMLMHAFSQISNMILYYLEDSITELNMNTASRASSIQGLAVLSGHEVTRPISSTGEISISLVSNPTITGNQILIPRYSRIKCLNNNVIYLLDLVEEDIRISLGATNSLKCKVIQGEIQTQIFTSDGKSLQSYFVQERGFNFIENFFVRVYVNGTEWKKFDSIHDIPKDYNGFKVRTSIGGGIDIFFGNSSFGKIPPLGAEIKIQYLRSAGESGDIREGESVYFQWLDTAYSLYGEEIDLNEITSVRISKPIMFGANAENISLTKVLAPNVSRSFVLANPINYVTFLMKYNFFSVIDAYNSFDDEYLDDDNVIYLFLIPDIKKRLTDGENYFTVPQKFFTLTDNEKQKVDDVIEDSGSKIVTSVVKIVDPIVSRFVLNVSLVTFIGYNTETIREKIIQAASDYFLNNKRRDRIPQSDLIKIFEAVEGVDSVNVNFISENDENLLKSDILTTPLEIDEFGDIIIGRETLPLIRGGWSDRNGIFYYDGLFSEKPCSLNIFFKKITQKRLV